MARKINRSSIELFVEAYLKRLEKNNNTRKERKFIQKSITLIELKLNNPCCDDPEAVTELITWRNNQLTNTVYATVKDVDKRRNRKALLRTQEMLRDALINCCYTEITISFNVTQNTKITFYNDLLKKEYVLPVFNSEGEDLTYIQKLPDVGKYNITLEQLEAGDGFTLESDNVSLNTGGVMGKYTQNMVEIENEYTLSDIV